MDPQKAKAFAEKHVLTWNSHDLEEILAMYADDIQLSSPLAVKVMGRSLIQGKTELREYFRKGLEKYPNLQFRLLNTLYGAESLALYFTSIDDNPVAEVITLADDGRIRKVAAHYCC